jgi:succinate-semialdehyde dehydrogenase/glutarate-semialdehyde dehydrogenase
MSIQALQTDQPTEVISRNPATGEEIGRISIASAEEIQNALQSARLAQPAWAALSFKERGRVILEAREIVLAELEEIAQLISHETGKPVAEAISMEVVPTLDLMYYFAHHTAKLLRPQRIDIGQYGFMGRSSSIVYRPLGVVGIISPWNFPWATPLDEIIMALMAGNAVVVKPSEFTTLTALKIGEIFKRTSLPTGVLQIVAGGGTTGAALIDAGGLNKIMFTGSVATGKRVAEAAAKYLTPVVLELGGKDPMIVLADADIANAARAAVWGAFANSGQACASVERCYVDERVAEEFTKLVVAGTRALKQGDPVETEIDIGAMTNEKQLLIVEDHVDSARRMGAQILTGGERIAARAGWFYKPTVLTNVDHTMKIMREETFGPVLPIMTFKTEAEAVRLANDSVFGLTGCIWTKDIARGRRLAEQIDAGTVMINEVVYTHAIAQTPWGGVKQSGYGRTHGKLGLLGLVSPHHIHVNRVAFLPDLWWFHYTTEAGKLFRSLATYFTTGSILRSVRLLPQMLQRLRKLR